MNESGSAIVEPVALVGMACRYPDADDPGQLWENVLDRRRAFRALPRERLDVDDYFDPDPAAVDRTYSARAAVLDGWEFDRSGFRVPRSVYRAADPAHWLALETAARALDDAGLSAGGGIDRQRVAVVVGNTLTGEVTRARSLRLRWPYTRRVLSAALDEAGVPPEQQRVALDRAAELYRSPFPESDDETLAGGLSNTIAGRICNHFDFGGGGYTVDGACSSSLLALIDACRQLSDGSADVALAGGVDLSLDPFELVGFAKAGALAADRMRVYDENSGGFWPGEGCGMVTLMRATDARRAGLPVRAEISGWGVSSDGHGGITRPELRGQLSALRRAYAAAGTDPGEVLLHEGHGTGTAVGDEVELDALARLRESAPTAAALGSIKANIGHTKAAAGVASLIKAVRSVETGVLPPITGCEVPHRRLREASGVLRAPDQPEPWPRGPRVAGVSALGFGGINTHLVVRGESPGSAVSPVVRRPPPPEAEVVAVGAEDAPGLRAILRRISVLAPRLSEAELRDLACRFGREFQGPVRAGLVAATAEELGKRADSACALLDDAASEPRLRGGDGAYVGAGVAGRVGLLFPGQGAPAPYGGGALAEHWPGVCSQPRSGEREPGTAGAQQRIHRASMNALRWLDELGVRPVAAVGHSLGEFASLVWAGCLSEEEAVGLVRERGRVMHRDGAPGTGMISIGADEEQARELCTGTGLVVAAFNGPRSHVLAGPLGEVRAVAEHAAARGLAARMLRVSHAFHSTAMSESARGFAPLPYAAKIAPPRRRVLSTVSGEVLTGDDDVAELLARQLTEPVRFRGAVAGVRDEVDLFCETGPGHTLSALLPDSTSIPVASVDAGSDRDRPLAETAAALFAARAVPDLAPVFEGRAARPFDLWRDPVFVSNPCSSAPDIPGRDRPRPENDGEGPPRDGSAPAPQRLSEPEAGSRDAAAVTRHVLAEATDLGPETMESDTRLLADLHLTSLRVIQLVAEIADSLGRKRPEEPLSPAHATIAELVETVEALPEVEETVDEAVPTGVEPWVRCFTEQHHPCRPAELPVAEPGRWRAHVPGGRGLSAVAADLLSGQDTPVLYAPEPTSPENVEAALRAGRAGVEAGGLVAVTHGAELTGFLRGLHHEHTELGITVLRVPTTVEGLRSARRHVRAEPGRWCEYVLTEQGFAEPVEAPLELDRAGDLPLGDADVLLVSGGGKGIGHECAAALARASGVRLALLGRSAPEDDERLAENLRLLREEGLAVDYESADVTDAAQVRRAVRRLRDRLGGIDGVLHASGGNEPVRFAQLDAAEVHDHVAPKVTGLRHLLDEVDSRKLRVLVTFGSVISTWGLRGESHYALANAALRAEAQRLAGALPGCRVLNVDWSVWSGAGMGERLGALDALTRAGVTAIPLAEGTETFLRLLADERTPSSVAVHGRLGTLSGTGQHTAGTALGRFLERIRLHCPGVELITEASLDLSSDPYGAEHRLDGTAVLPGVVLVEAMTQAASQLAGRTLREVVDLRLDRPVVLPETGSRDIRVCVLRRAGAVEAVLRSAETDFRVEHARASFPLTTGEPCRGEAPRSAHPPGGWETDPLGPEQLYGSLYFHSGQFRRVRELVPEGARRCRARVLAKDLPDWFDVEPLLGSPAVNDATVHALQACVPHRRLLPVSCERLVVAPSDSSELWVHGSERRAEGGRYLWDVVVRDPDGVLVLAWYGLTLRDVGPLSGDRPWPESLLAVYLERTGTTLGKDPRLRVSVRRAEHAVPRDSARSRDSAAGLVFEVAGTERVGCAAEPVGADEGMPGLPEEDRTLAARLGRPCPEPFGSLAARVRTVRRTLGEAGRDRTFPLEFDGVYEGGVVLFRAGPLVITSVVVPVLDVPDPVAVAILTEDQ
ncbi:enediyne polyketide synthase [Actinopolyspora biskrensis]|uniref:Enediyne polyketide synthase n=1 Tax=Actinopolyspora biskrensis TaxID=1470178 RepID=A0A852Z5M6_9ACTN|nr:enediyne polyketide synthase [Actinopolyspora biskrensis]